MNIAKLLGIPDDVTIILVGNFEPTNIADSNNQPYYSVKLKTPVTVRCSTDNQIIPFETDEVFVRKADVFADGWDTVNGKDEKDGFFMKNWVVDFSKGQQLAIYQSETIKSWAKDNRKDKRTKGREAINTALRLKIENSKK